MAKRRGRSKKRSQRKERVAHSIRIGEKGNKGRKNHAKRTTEDPTGSISPEMASNIIAHDDLENNSGLGNFASSSEFSVKGVKEELMEEATVVKEEPVEWQDHAFEVNGECHKPSDTPVKGTENNKMSWFCASCGFKGMSKQMRCGHMICKQCFLSHQISKMCINCTVKQQYEKELRIQLAATSQYNAGVFLSHDKRTLNVVVSTDPNIQGQYRVIKCPKEELI